MYFIRSGEVRIISYLPESRATIRIAKVIAWTARQYWRDLLKKVPVVEHPLIVLHNRLYNPGTAVWKKARLLTIDLDGIANTATNLQGDSRPGTLLLRAIQISLSEELHHLWKLYQGKLDFSSCHCKIGGNLARDMIEVIKHYAEEDEFEALEFSVEKTQGKRVLLLAQAREWREIRSKNKGES